MSLRLALVLLLTLAAGCSAGPVPRTGPTATGERGGPAGLAEGTCWTGELLGADPQDVLAMSKQYDVPYLVAARAIATWPAFAHGVSCDGDHAVEVYKVVRPPGLDTRLGDYAALLRQQSPLRRAVDRRVASACMSRPLARAAARTGLAGAVMEPVLPAGASLGWAPAPPKAWGSGHREFGCTLSWKVPRSTRYRTVFSNAFPIGSRTCIDSRALLFVDCARGHDRERIAVIEAGHAVAAGAFPGPAAVRAGPHGPYLDVDDATYARLDAACTAYLRSVSTTKRLTGVANIDVDDWPMPDGSYPIYCDADRRPDQESLVTTGSVYDRS